MGIKGLTTFISNQPNKYLIPHELRDTHLIIDGNSLSCQLYNSMRQSNSAFGGEYDRYARCLDKFFHELEQCNVTALVLFDGASEDKKLPTHISRTKDKIRRASLFGTHFTQHKFFPLFLKRATLEVLDNRNIKYTQTLFEADNEIAAIGRILSCPVLSYDSDFFVLGCSYIPFDTLEHGVSWKSDTVKFKRCKIYHMSNFLKNFKGLRESVFPLCAILLGNDYVTRITFKSFDSQIKINKSKNHQNESQIRIREVLDWLRYKTLDKAVAGILGTFPKTARKKILAIIEQILQCYTYFPSDALLRFNFDATFISEKHLALNVQPFKFQGDIYNLGLTVEEECPLENIEDVDFDTHEETIDKLPAWFIEDFKNAKLPDYFIDLLTRRLCICRVQIEDQSQPCSLEISWDILKTMYAILASGSEEDTTVMFRGENMELKRELLPYPHDISNVYNLPPLQGLRSISLLKRRQILTDTLLIESPQLLEAIPDKWKLYIATMNYWIRQPKTSFAIDKAHVYALLFTLLIEVMDEKIGYMRSIKDYERRYKRSLQPKTNQPTQNNESVPFEALSFALANVKKQDCHYAWAFFSEHFQTKEKLLMRTRTFNIRVVHVFATFQNCLWHSIDLNSLLGCPLPQSIIKNLLTGTFFYNLCTNFTTRLNLDRYISTVLKDSPTLLQLFQLMVNKVEFVWATSAVESKLSESGQKKKRKRKKKKKQRAELESIDIGTSSLDGNEDQNDYPGCTNNQYYLLTH